MSNSSQRTSALPHSMLALFIILIAGWCNTSLASTKYWCASEGGDLNCVPFEYGPWSYRASYSPYFAVAESFSTPTDAYSALAELTMSRMTQANCTYTLSALSAFTSRSDLFQYAAATLSYGGPNCGYGTASNIGYISGTKERWCPQGANNYGFACVEPTSYKIEIQGASLTTEPWHKKWDQDHTSSNSNLPFKAVVENQNGQPKANVAVYISSGVTPGSGGHAHNNNRPKGRLVPNTTGTGLSNGAASISGQTDGSGQFSFTFGAEEASGEHTLTATCTGCSNTATTNINVEIPNLMLLDADPLSYSLTGDLPEHLDNHYFSPAAMVKIINLAHAYLYDPDFGKPLIINDSSLEKGGVFDIKQDWTYLSNMHGGHRVGVVVDINNYHVPNPDFVQFAADKGIQANWHGKGTGPHYHLLLLNEDH